MKYAYHTKPPKVEAAASTDQSRPALASVWFDVDRAELQATDSYIAARIPVEVGLGEVSGFVQPAALKASRKRDASGLHINGAVDVMPAGWDGDGDIAPLVSFPREDRGQFPKIDQLWPTGDYVFTVGINAKFLARLADALGAEDGAVTLRFQAGTDKDGKPLGDPNPLRPILVTPNRGSTDREAPPLGIGRAEGLIMPVRVS